MSGWALPQPPLPSQISWVQLMPSEHVLAKLVPLQVPATQVSSLVQLLPSSHLPPLTGDHLVWLVSGVQAIHGSEGLGSPFLKQRSSVVVGPPPSGVTEASAAPASAAVPASTAPASTAPASGPLLLLTRTASTQVPVAAVFLHTPRPAQVSVVQVSLSLQFCSPVGWHFLSGPQTGSRAHGSWALHDWPGVLHE